MADLGLTWVRIAEFAWARMEPRPGQYAFDWLDDAIEVLGAAGLKVVLGTPTATPPRWMIDNYPDMIAVDAQGRPRKFGSRRHYCFSHEGYRAECARIVTQMARRYGNNPHVGAWQTDNEYGCHDTVISYSDAARTAFQSWLRSQFANDGNGGDIAALNTAWGNVFWSMDYDDFEQIDLPNLTVTEPNPAHALAFRRFSSDQVVSFNRLQTDIIRAHSDAPISHNFMGKVTSFDHFKLGADLDIATWDSYPLGFLSALGFADADQIKYFARQGDPDFQAFHHDLYRAAGRGRWWIMEQQPGPVNWAPFNPAPREGMVRLWTWEAFAHGAEAVCYFRWRQAPMAQEQMHAGILRPDSAPAQAHTEVAIVAGELASAPDVSAPKARAAIVFDYDADFAWAVQPHGRGLAYFNLVFAAYRALRSMGLSIDILPPDTRDFSGRDLVLVPGMMHLPDDLKAALAASDAQVVYGPRSAARDQHMTIPVPLPPAIDGLDVTVSYVESFAPDQPVALQGVGAITGYREHLEGTAQVILRDAQGGAVAMSAGRLVYLGAWLDHAGWRAFLAPICRATGFDVLDLPVGVRCRETAGERFWFNYDSTEQTVQGHKLAPISVLRELLHD
jgi:beta-galactosidase